MLGVRQALAPGGISRSIRHVPSQVSRPSTSRFTLRSPNADRYLTIHNFFTRQAIPSIPNQIRFNSTKSPQHHTESPNTPKIPATPTHTPVQTPPGHAQDYTPFIRRLIGRSSSLTTSSPTRPTKEQLLAAAGSWWERLRVRLKWFTIRGWRRFNADDYGAFASVFVLGNSRYFPSTTSLLAADK